MSASDLFRFADPAQDDEWDDDDDLAGPEGKGEFDFLSCTFRPSTHLRARLTTSLAGRGRRRYGRSR